MASPCEILVDTADRATAARALEVGAREAWRIEQKFSRYRDDSVVSRIHASRGHPLSVDEETALLLDFADPCYRLSEGRFDITSGVLRRVWTFDGSDRIPEPAAVAVALASVGWTRVQWDHRTLVLPPEMEIDLGGIGKEYAVDSALGKIEETCSDPVLVNFGGDLRANRPRRNDRPWRVGIEAPTGEGSGTPSGGGATAGPFPAAARALSPKAGEANGSVGVVELSRGGIATSGDSRRFLLRDGVRYSHILDPRTGWPVVDAPRSVTVAAATCVEAGMLATFAMLQGVNAEAFLSGEGVRSWCVR
ncbi:MAG: FAD:protein FMN transferase [Candidatus Eisenbacteria bacterium]